MTLSDVYNYLAHAYIELRAGNLGAGTIRVGILLDDLEKSFAREAEKEQVTVRYDLSPANIEQAIKDKLIQMGWTPPTEGGNIEPVGEIVRSFSNGSGLDVKFYKPLTSDIPDIVGTKLYALPKEKDL